MLLLFFIFINFILSFNIFIIGVFRFIKLVLIFNKLHFDEIFIAIVILNNVFNDYIEFIIAISIYTFY